MNTEPLSLVFARNDTIPSDDGVVYNLRDGLHREIFLWGLNTFDDENDKQPIYMLSEYPTNEVIDKIRDKYKDEDWFDDELLVERLARGYYINRVNIYIENNYLLPYQELEYENGHVIAYDEKNECERELVRVSLWYEGENYGSFFMLSRGQDMDLAQYLSVISHYDSKIPTTVRNNWDVLRSMIEKWDTKKIEIKVEDVYVFKQ